MVLNVGFYCIFNAQNNFSTYQALMNCTLFSFLAVGISQDSLSLTLSFVCSIILCTPRVVRDFQQCTSTVRKLLHSLLLLWNLRKRKFLRTPRAFPIPKLASSLRDCGHRHGTVTQTPKRNTSAFSAHTLCLFCSH